MVLKDDIRQTEEQLAIALKAIVKRRVSSFAQPDVIVVSVGDPYSDTLRILLVYLNRDSYKVVHKMVCDQ